MHKLMKLTLVLSLAIFSLPFSTAAETAHELVGSFSTLSLKDKRNALGMKNYVKLETAKGKMALPVTFSNKKVESFIKKNKGKYFFIKAVPTTKKILKAGEESGRTVSVLKVISAKVISLGDIGKVASEHDGSEVKMGKSEKPYHPTYKGVNDKVTNTIIYTAGAALLGAILFGK